MRHSVLHPGSLALTAGLLLSGCASPYVNQHIEAVNAEYRELEVYSYELERENKQLCDQIETLKGENEELRGGAPRRRPALGSPNRSTTPRSTPRSTPSTDLSPPSVDVPDISLPEPSPAQAPVLPPVIPPLNAPRGGGSGLSPRTPISSQKPAENSLPLLPPAPKPPRPIQDDPPPEPLELELPAGELPPPAPGSAVPEPIDGKVTHLFLNPLLTRGANLDSQPGDDGLALVLEPRNQAGQFVPHAGPVSIVVLDPTKQGDAARVARWNLDEKLVRQRLSRSSSTRGIHLQLPWAGGVPETNQVKLFVQYETADGRKVQAQHDLILNPAAHASNRWTPRSGDRPRAEIPAQPLLAGDGQPPKSVSAANPPLPAPPVQSDLTKVAPAPFAAPAPMGSQLITEPVKPQTNIATKQPPADSPPLLAPPPKSERPQWQPYR